MVKKKPALDQRLQPNGAGKKHAQNTREVGGRPSVAAPLLPPSERTQLYSVCL